MPIAPHSRPNLVVLLTDQQRWDTVGLHGGPRGLTPHFDRLARRGTFFAEAVTPQPVCGPARSCLQTGQFATTTGVWKNGPGLRPGAPLLAETLRDAGYRTSYVGKWHLSEGTGDGPVPEGNRGGYERWLAANCVELVSGPYSTLLFDEHDRPVRLPGYRVDAVVDAAIRQLAAHAAEPAEDRQPLLLFISLLEPHHQNTDDSYPAPNGLEARWREALPPADLRALGGSSAQHWAGYLGMIQRIDEALGRLDDALVSTGLTNDTVVAFTSDHGCHFKTRNAEYKRSPHESSVRVPFGIWGPGWDGGGERRDAASLVDLMPSLLDSAGVPIPAAVQGRSLHPHRHAPATAPDDALIQFGDAWMAPGRALRTPRWKLAATAPEEFQGRGDAPEYHVTHLFDLRSDPHELANLVDSSAHAPVIRDLGARLLARMAAIGEPPACLVTPPSSTAFSQRSVQWPGEG